MSNAVASKADVRKQLRTLSSKEFIAPRTKVNMVAVAGVLGVTLSAEDSSKMTKQAIYDEIVAGANLPDPALRGKSTVDGPVARAWDIADKMFTKAREAKGDYVAPRRKDVVAAMQEAGIAYYTARTQYQVFYTVTNKATRPLADVPVEELPKALQPAPEPKEEA